MAPRVLLPLLALLSAVASVALLRELWRAGARPSGCNMTYSWPVYTPLPEWLKRQASSPQVSPLKYELASVHMHARRAQLTGVPLLFVPGHLGSHKQARSLARHLGDRAGDAELFDVFALDFGAELSGLSGALVRQQAHFINDAVRAILRQYRKQFKKKTGSERKRKVAPPSSVVIVAHSMGGVAARLAQTLPNYASGSIRHVVTLGTPYERPPFPFDPDMQEVYSEIAHSVKKEVEEEDDDDSASVYVSIAGGHKDWIVHAPLSGTDRVAHPSRSVAVLTTAMPSVQLTMDHLCLLWCHQLLDRVAWSLVAVVDAEKRELVRSSSLRFAAARDVLLGDGADDTVKVVAVNATTVLLHKEYVRNGYHTLEFETYEVAIPQLLFHLLRSNLATVVLVMYALTLHIFSLQVARWQTAFSIQSASPGAAQSPSPSTQQQKFPSFVDMLDPVAHVPTFIKSAVALLTGSSGDAANTTTMRKTAMVALLSAAAIGAVGLAVETGRRNPAFAIKYGIVLELFVLYVYALGLLYAIAVLLSAVRSLVASPLVSALQPRFKHTPRWMIIGSIFVVVFIVGHVESVAPFKMVVSMESSRNLALLVLGSFAVFMMYLVALGANTLTSADQQRMQRSLFAVFALSLVPWVGKLLYFVDIVRFPPPELSNGLLIQGSMCILMLSLARYLVTFSQENMLPMPPIAFFGAASGQDAGSAYDDEKSSSSSNGVKITAENCPKCVFEDGGPGAILVEYTDASTKRLQCRHEVVLVGPSFRVVSCDCVFRFENPRLFCEFCTRSCRLCGGGAGNFQHAQKYNEFLAETQIESAKHALVPLLFELLAFAQLSVGLHREHLMFYFTPVCTLALLVYHLVLLSPVEAKRRKNKLNKSKKKKRKSKSKTSTNSSSSTPSKAVPSSSSSKSESVDRKQQTATNSSTSSSSSSNGKKSGGAKTNKKTTGQARNPNVPESLFVNPIYEMVDDE